MLAYLPNSDIWCLIKNSLFCQNLVNLSRITILFSLIVRRSVWPDVGIKRSLILPQRLSKNSTAVLTQKDLLFKRAQIITKSTFDRKTVAKNFQKSQNLVTLVRRTQSIQLRQMIARAVASVTTGPRFKTSHRQLILNIFFTINCIEKTKIKKKRPVMGHIFNHCSGFLG